MAELRKRPELIWPPERMTYFTRFIEDFNARKKFIWSPVGLLISSPSENTITLVTHNNIEWHTPSDGDAR